MTLMSEMHLRSFTAGVIFAFGIYLVTGANAQGQGKPVMDKQPDAADHISSKPGAKDGRTTVEVPVLMFVPVQVSTDLEHKGCWVKFYDKKDFEGDSLMLAGPINLPRMTGPFGYDWEDKVRSVKTGPKANLTIYDNRDYRDADKFINAGSSVPDLSEKMGFFDNFRSMMLSCI